MFLNSSFSARTVATVSSMADRSSNKKKEDYKWRKDMEE